MPASPSSHGATSRRPLVHQGKRVPNIFTRTDANSRLRFEFQRKLNGKSTRVTLKATTPTDAVQEANRLRAVEVNLGDRSVRLGPLAEALFVAMKSGEFTHNGKRYAPRSIELMEQRAESHVLDALGRGTRVADIRVGHLRAMMRRLMQDGLSGSTVRSCLAVASAILRFAVEQEVIERNPASDIGRGERPSGKRQSEPRYLSVAQVETLLGKMTDDSRPIAAALFWAGLRVSEALALRWSDVGSDTLNVPGTKSEASAASVPLLAPLAAELRAHRQRMGERGFDRIRPNALVFATRSGKPVGRRNVLRAVQAAGEKVGLSTDEHPLGCHDLRHSLAANALGLGLSLTEVSRLLRHADPNITGAVYADLTDEGVAAIATKLAALG